MASRAASAEPKTRRRDLGRRVEILEAAARVFAARGYAAATMRDVGDAAGILSGSLYHHFASKDEMLEELVRPFLVGLVEMYAEIASSDASPAEQMRGLVAAAYQVVADQPTMVTILQNEVVLLRSNPRFQFVSDLDAEIRGSWLHVLARGQAAGLFRPDIDPRLAYRMLMGSTLSAVRWFRPRGQDDVESPSTCSPRWCCTA